MDAFPSAGRSPRARWFRQFLHQPSSLFPSLCLRWACLLSACLLLILAGGVLLWWPGGQAQAAQAASCPISGLPPPPTSGSPLDPSTIILNEILANPQADWNCDGKLGDQWIELKNTSDNDESLLGLQLQSGRQIITINSADYIAAHGYLVIFGSQLSTFSLPKGSSLLQLLDGNGQTIDSVGYPALDSDRSYARTSSGQWAITSTPTPGTANIITNDSNPTPTPTQRTGGGGGGGGGGSGGGNGGGGSGNATATPTPNGTVVLPTDTAVAVLQNQGDSSGSGGSSNQSMPSWLKIGLIALISVTLLVVVIWYIRSWRHQPEGDR